MGNKCYGCVIYSNIPVSAYGLVALLEQAQYVRYLVICVEYPVTVYKEISPLGMMEQHSLK